MNDKQQRAHAHWLQDLRVLAVLVHYWDQAASDLEKRKWKTAVDLQVKQVKWRERQFPKMPRPKEFTTCDGATITWRHIQATLKKMKNWQ